MTTPGHRPPPRRRGRRPAGEDTRDALLEAARGVFTEHGYEGSTVRAIAARADVDPAMVNHWFGGKEGLFATAVLQVPFDANELIATITAGGPEQMGERVVRAFISRWDGVDGGRFAALVRSITSRPEAMQALRTVLVGRVFATVTQNATSDRPELRASLAASQVFGLGMMRYVARVEPIASADINTLVTALAPTLQRYFTGDLD